MQGMQRRFHGEPSGVQGELFPRDADDDAIEHERSYVDFLDLSLMETTGDHGGAAGALRRRAAVEAAHRAWRAYRRTLDGG
jgi:hypothetical protein